MTVLTATPKAISGRTNLRAGAARAPRFDQGDLAGIVLNQNQSATQGWPFGNSFLYQTFTFPESFPRGDRSIDQRIPALQGLQIFTGITNNRDNTAGIDWRFDHYEPGEGWTPFRQGTSVGAPTDGSEVWFTVTFAPQDITDLWQNTWRFGIRGRNPGGAYQQVVQYKNATERTVVIDSTDVSVFDIGSGPLQEGRTYVFDFQGTPSVIEVVPGSGKLLYSTQQGINKVWVTTPNPLAAKEGKALDSDGVTPLISQGREASINFRILAEVADSGRDFLGNSYRNYVLRSTGKSTDPADPKNFQKFWMSKPNPSKFAVEEIFFDVRKKGKPAVIDQILVDPITPGVYFNVYWSNEGQTPWPTQVEGDWNHKLWHPVHKSFKMQTRRLHNLPRAIKAKFIKVEFVHLQARHYDPEGKGNHAPKKQKYHKFPRWVLAHYMPDDLTVPQEGGSGHHHGHHHHHHGGGGSHHNKWGESATVSYSATDLLYNIYSGDMFDDSEDTTPVDETTVSTNFTNPVEAVDADQADPTTLAKVSTGTTPYQDAPFDRGSNEHILKAQTAPPNQDYPSEAQIRPKHVSSDLRDDQSDKDVLHDERKFPVMRFFKTCRHKYKNLIGKYKHHTAYFVGINEISFHRKTHHHRHDPTKITDNMNDNVLMDLNDFVVIDGGDDSDNYLATYDPTS